MSEEERLCDQEDCEYYFYPKTVKETKVEEKNHPIINMSSPHSHAMTISQLTAYSQMQYSASIASTMGTISADSFPKNIMSHA